MPNYPSRLIKVTKDEFRDMLLKNLKRQTSYIPKMVDKKIKELGMGRYFGKNASKTATKAQTVKAIKAFQKEGIMKKTYTPEQQYGKIVKTQIQAREETKVKEAPELEKADGGRSLFSKLFSARNDSKNIQEDGEPDPTRREKIDLGLEHLPKEGIGSAYFVRYMERLLSEKSMQHLVTIMGQWGMLGARKILTKPDMKQILFKMRSDGLIPFNDIGQELAVMERRRKVFVSEGIAEELHEQERRYDAKTLDSLPEGVRRSVLPKAASSVARLSSDQRSSGAVRPTTSISRAQKNEAEKKIDEKPVSSIGRYRQRQMKTKKEPSDKSYSLPDILAGVD